jgi:hypothetical protein
LDSRVGLFLGLIAAIATIGIGSIAVSEAYRHVDYEYEKLACLLSENGNQKMMGDQFKAMADASRCGLFPSYETYSSLHWQVFGQSVNKNGFPYVRTTEQEKQHNAIVAVAWTIGAASAAFAMVFLICWTMGWIFAGFSKS